MTGVDSEGSELLWVILGTALMALSERSRALAGLHGVPHGFQFRKIAFRELPAASMDFALQRLEASAELLIAPAQAAFRIGAQVARELADRKEQIAQFVFHP